MPELDFRAIAARHRELANPRLVEPRDIVLHRPANSPVVFVERSEGTRLWVRSVNAR